MTPLSSLALFRMAAPTRLPDAPSVAEVRRAVRAVHEALAGIQPDEITLDEADAIRRIANGDGGAA